MIHPPPASITRRILDAANRHCARSGDLPRFRKTMGTTWLQRIPRGPDPQP